MSIVKKVNGNPETIANISVIDHNQLSNRNAYGCHSISAIRKLPEKLTELKNQTISLQEQIEVIKNNSSGSGDIDITIPDNLQETLSDLENKARQIGISKENSNLIFTNFDGETKSIKSDEVDDVTVHLNDSNEISLKKVFVDDTLSGTGTAIDPLSVKKDVLLDNSTISKNDHNQLVVRALSDPDFEPMTAPIIRNNFTQVNTSISNINNNLNNIDKEINDIELLNDEQDNKLYDLENRTKGMGGYLNTYNFGKNPTQDDFTNYALQDIGIEDRHQIFNGTKVINSYDKHTWSLTNTPDSNPAVFSWSDLGITKDISVANNKTFGLVKGSIEDYEGSIDALGHISINGLTELDKKVSDNQQVMHSNFDEVNHNVGDISDLQQTVKDGAQVSSIMDVLKEHNQRILSEFDEVNKLTGDVSDLQETVKDYVDKTSDQTVNGTKTFTNFNLQVSGNKPIQMQAVEGADLLIQQSNATLGTSVSIKSTSINDVQALTLAAQKGTNYSRLDITDSGFILDVSDNGNLSSIDLNNNSLEVVSPAFIYNNSQVVTMNDIIDTTTSKIKETLLPNTTVEIGNLIESNGFTSYIDINNTTLKANVQDIFKYLNNQKGGSLISLSIKTGTDNIVGDVITITESESGSSIDTDYGQPILSSNSFYYLYPEQIFANGNDWTICFGCKTNYPYGKGIVTLKATKNTATGLFENPTATIAGEAFYTHNGSVYRYYFQDVNILEETLAHLTIKYIFYPD